MNCIWQTILVFFITLTCVIAAEQGGPQQVELKLRFKKSVQPFLKANCLDCHGKERQEAKLDLSIYSSASEVAHAHQIWEIVLDRLAANEMPPEEAKRQPSKEQRKSVILWIRAVRKYEAARNAGDPGPVLARRLSNAEYNYSIRDLTGVDIQPTKTFPIDPANSAGFDNSGESLSMSPALLKKYLQAARHVVEHLVLKPNSIAFAPHPVVTDTDRDKYCVKRIVQFYRRQPTDYADYFFAAWRFKNRKSLGKQTALLADFAADAKISPKYLSTIWTTLNQAEEVGPIAKLQAMWRELPTDSNKARLGCDEMREFVAQLRDKLKPKIENITIDGSHKGSQPFVLWKNRQYAANRRSYDRKALVVEKDKTEKTLSHLIIPANEKAQARYRAAFERFCSVFPDAFYVSERGRDYLDKPQKEQERGRLLSAGFHSMMGYFRDDQPLYDLILSKDEQHELDALWHELDFVTSAPMRQYSGFLWFERTDSRYMRDPVFDFARAEDKSTASESMIWRLSKVYLEKARGNGGNDVAIKSIEHYFKNINDQIRWVENARLKAERSHLDAIIKFAARAYRRPLSAAERDEFFAFYQSLRKEDGLGHEEAVQDAIVSILMSPFFCYRVDHAGEGDGARPLTGIELASRLSYFLWASMPDRQLIERAVAGDLNRPEILVAQARRMMKDERVIGLANEFAGNWLDFRRFQQHNSVDRNRFPTFTDELREAMFEEPIRFFADVVQNDRSVLDFLYADHTFVNPVLAKHYGVEVASGSWQRVDDAGRFQRGGLLPMSVFLTKNAPGLRTSPVKRGYWVVRRLLGERIPPPPPNVPELPNDETKLGDLTLREVLARHRDHKSCAGCHQRFDSIGLAFENFGPIGELREKDLGGRDVQTTAKFPGGDEGNGLDGLRQYLREHRQDEFIDNFCRKLLSYALGRTLLLSDDLLVEQMREKLATNEFRFSSLIEGIVTSSQFLNKRVSIEQAKK